MSRSSIKVGPGGPKPVSLASTDISVGGDDDELLFNMNSTELEDNITDHFKAMLSNVNGGINAKKHRLLDETEKKEMNKATRAGHRATIK